MLLSSLKQTKIKILIYQHVLLRFTYVTRNICLSRFIIQLHSLTKPSCCTLLTERHSRAMIPCVRSFPSSILMMLCKSCHFHDMPEWLEKACCLSGIKNNPCEKGQTLLCVNSGSKMTASNPEQRAKKAFGVSPRNKYGKNTNSVHGKSPDFMEDTFSE